MNDAKPVASLSAHLLARKGTAKPAMRPSVQTHFEHHVLASIDDNSDDLGWNDMGEDDHTRHAADILPLTPAPVRPESKAEAAADDIVAAAQLAENARKIAASHSLNPSLTAEKPQVVQQREEIAERLAGNDTAATGDGSISTPVSEIPADQPQAERQTTSKSTQSEPATSSSSRTASKRRAAFTLRLDRDRHLKLRLASTIRNRSAQQIVTEALDRLLGEIPELESLAAQLKRQ